MELTSRAFADGEHIPERHTCGGADVSSPLAWSQVPAGARSLALVVDDPDAPGRTFTHWLAWNIDPATEGLGEGEAGAAEGRNDFGAPGYRGPCPPPGHGPHHYHFRLYTLDAALEVTPGASRRDVERSLEGHVLETAELIGVFER